MLCTCRTLNNRPVHGGPAAKALNGLFQAAVQGWQGLPAGADPASPVQTLAPAHPAFLLRIACPRALYDATLDPAKTLVEFADWGPVLAAVRDAACQSWRASLPCSLAPPAPLAAKPEPTCAGVAAGPECYLQRAPVTTCSDSFALWLASESQASAAVQWPAAGCASGVQAAGRTACQKRCRLGGSAPCPGSARTAVGDERASGFQERRGRSKRPRPEVWSIEGGQERGQPVGRSRLGSGSGSGSGTGSGLPRSGGSSGAAWCALASAQRRAQGACAVPPERGGPPAQDTETLQGLDEPPLQVSAIAGRGSTQMRACAVRGLQESAHPSTEHATALTACTTGSAEADMARRSSTNLGSRVHKRRPAASAPPDARRVACIAHANLACSLRSAAADPRALEQAVHSHRLSGRPESLGHSPALDISHPARPGNAGLLGSDGAARPNAEHASSADPAGALGADTSPGPGGAARKPLPAPSIQGSPSQSTPGAAGRAEGLPGLPPKPTCGGQEAQAESAPTVKGLLHGGNAPPPGLGLSGPHAGLAAEPRVLDLQELAGCGALVPPALCRAHLASARPLAQATSCPACHAHFFGAEICHNPVNISVAAFLIIHEACMHASILGGPEAPDISLA